MGTGKKGAKLSQRLHATVNSAFAQCVLRTVPILVLPPFL